ARYKGIVSNGVLWRRKTAQQSPRVSITGNLLSVAVEDVSSVLGTTSLDVKLDALALDGGAEAITSDLGSSRARHSVGCGIGCLEGTAIGIGFAGLCLRRQGRLYGNYVRDSSRRIEEG